MKQQTSHLSRAKFMLCAVTAMCSFVTVQAQNGINTVAGGGSINGPAMGNNADIPGPTNVITDAAGNLYTISPDSNQVFEVSTSGSLSLFAGLGWPEEEPKLLDGQAAVSGSLNRAAGLAIDSNGNIYIADTVDYLIRQVSPTSGVMTTVAGWGHYCNYTDNCGDGHPATAEATQLANPNGVATDAAGNIYIADTDDNRIRVVNMQSAPITIARQLIQPRNIATVAGSLTPLADGTNTCPSPTQSCGDGGQAKSAYLNSPNGVAVDSQGNIFIADSGDHRIREVMPSGIISAYAGDGTTCLPTTGQCGDGGPATAAQLTNPSQLYIDAQNNLYIADPPTNRIREVLAGSPPTITTVAGTGVACSSKNITPTFCGDTGPATNALLNSPHGVYLDASGNLNIADTGDQRIRQVNAAGVINTDAGGGLSDGPALSAILAGDRDVVVDGSGSFYIVDTANNRVRKVSGGNITTVAGNGIAGYFDGPVATANLNGPRGLALDSAGNIYIADTENLRLRVINTQSSPLTVAGVTIQQGNIGTIAGSGKSCTPTAMCGDMGPATLATFTYPTTVALDGLGNIYVADQRANRVRVINSSGTISTFAGTTQLYPGTSSNACPNPTDFASCGDGGPATAAFLSSAYGVAADIAGNVFIADSGDNRIRVVDNTGNYCGKGFICAYAFNGAASFGPDGAAALMSSYIFPLYVALDSRDNLFVSGSSLYYVVQRIDYLTKSLLHSVNSIAGWPSGSPKYYGYTGDGGPALGAELNNFGVAIDGQEDLFIADGGNNRVREVSSSPSQGLVPVVKVSPTLLLFGSVPLGSQLRSMTVTVTNAGDDDLVMSPPSISPPYSFVNSSPCAGNMVAPDESCNYQIVLAPTGYGPENGQANLNDNSFNNPTQKIALYGSGPNYSLTANPNSLTNGGNSTITVTPSGGFNQLITFTVNGCPQGSNCSLNPTHLTPPAETQLTLNVQVGNTPPGTYNLSIAGSGVVSHNVIVQLIVQ